MNDKLKIDDKVIKALDLKVIRRLICKTDKGELELVIRKGENKYFLTIDSVPLERDVNKELMELLFPVKPEVPQVQKSIYQKLVEEVKPNKDKLTVESLKKLANEIENKEEALPIKKKLGRPKKTK